MTSPATPQLSVIVPVYEMSASLRDCLMALARQESAPPHEILVVDNGSTASIPPHEQARFPNVRWLQETTPGSYAARNKGIQEAAGQILAFTDADCQPAPDWLAKAAGALADAPDPAVIGGRISLAGQPGDNPYSLIEEEFGWLDQEHFIARRGFIATANLVANRALFAQVGAFDGCLLSGGDAEWSRRAAAGGATLRYAPAAVVAHPRLQTFGPFWRKTVRLAGAGASAIGRQHLSPLARLAWIFRQLRAPRMFSRHLRHAQGGLLSFPRLHLVMTVLAFHGVSTLVRVLVLMGVPGYRR